MKISTSNGDLPSELKFLVNVSTCKSCNKAFEPKLPGQIRCLINECLVGEYYLNKKKMLKRRWSSGEEMVRRRKCHKPKVWVTEYEP